MIKNRYAVVLVCDKNYIQGAQVAAYSVRQTSPNVDVVVLTHDTEVVNDPTLKQYTASIRLIDTNIELAPFRAWRKDFPQIVAEKMVVFRSSMGYEQLALMDADAIAIQDLEPLFLDNPTMLRGISTNATKRKQVIHGGFIIIPNRLCSKEAFNHLMATCERLNSTWEEQAILEAFRHVTHFIPSEIVYSPRSKLRLKCNENTRVIHYIGTKPWDRPRKDCPRWYEYREALDKEPVIQTTAKPIFDKVYCINLRRREDRWKQFQAEIAKQNIDFGVPIEQYFGMDGSLFTPPIWWGPYKGSWGCFLSHRALIEQCINDPDIHNVLIFQDDAIFTEGFMEKFITFHNNLPDDAQWIYYGGQHLRADEQKPLYINDYVAKPYNVNRLHAFALLGKPIMRKVHQHLCHGTPWPRRHNTDHHLGFLHETGKMDLYVPTEWLVFQSDGYSDLELKDKEHPRWRDAKRVGMATVWNPQVSEANTKAVPKSPTIAESVVSRCSAKLKPIKRPDVKK